MSRSVLASITLLLAIAFAVSPFFVTSFAGFDPNQFPVPQYNPPVQPAGYAFSIWGLIYVWLIVGLGWGWFYRREDAAWHAMRGPLAVSLAIGAVWLAVANASPVWATVLIWIMQQTALVALYRTPQTDRGWAAWPVGLYAGWLTAAASVSLGLLAAGYGWMEQTTAAYVFILFALVFAAGVQNTLRRAPGFGLAVIWALVAIVIANFNNNIGVAGLAAGGAIAMMFPTYKAFRAG